MLPAGQTTDKTVDQLSGLLESSDIITDGGNSVHKDDIRRAKKPAEKDIKYFERNAADAGPSED
jgi:6-phosphogluconate dehydrogenase